MGSVLLGVGGEILANKSVSFLWSKNGVKSFIYAVDRWLAVLKL